jgi:hypothetical protein
VEIGRSMVVDISSAVQPSDPCDLNTCRIDHTELEPRTFASLSS